MLSSGYVNLAVRPRRGPLWVWVVVMMLVSGPVLAATPDPDDGQIPATPLVFHTGEVYLYGNKVEPPYTLTAFDSLVTLNGIPVFPPLTRPELPPPPLDELAARQEDLTLRALGLNRQLYDLGLNRQVITDSVAALLAADSTVVDSVRIDSPLSLMVWWRNGQVRLIYLELGPAQPVRVRIAQQVRRWTRALEGDALVVYCRGWTCEVGADADKTALRAEIQRARTASRDLFDRQSRVRLAEDSYRSGTLPDSLRYLVGGLVWRGQYIEDAEDARMFRDPLPLPSRRN